ncbi:MAG TPA: histidine phosphotransferase family protein [Alphaproteobacteria bacterium]|nr:histidine phosphotransferase family protein [Alphaproteobacteria bacterium]
MADDLQLSALLCARLCHDLVGPVSALSNGVEFLGDEDPEMRQQAVDLLVQSAGQAARRLQFFRLAFGRLDGMQVPLAEVASAAQAFFADRRIELKWPALDAIPSEAPVHRSLKLLLNMALLASEALVRGGRLEAEASPVSFRVLAEGPIVELEATLRAALARGADEDGMALDEVTPRAIQPVLTARLARRVDAVLALSAPGQKPLELTARFT